MTQTRSLIGNQQTFKLLIYYQHVEKFANKTHQFIALLHRQSNRPINQQPGKVINNSIIQRNQMTVNVNNGKVAKSPFQLTHTSFLRRRAGNKANPLMLEVSIKIKCSDLILTNIIIR